MSRSGLQTFLRRRMTPLFQTCFCEELSGIDHRYDCTAYLPHRFGVFGAQIAGLVTNGCELHSVPRTLCHKDIIVR